MSISSEQEYEPGIGTRDVIAIGGSAGSLTPLQALVRALPSDLPAAVLVAIHQHRDGPGLLAGILEAAGALPVAMTEDGQLIEHGRIYVAPLNFPFAARNGKLRSKEDAQRARTASAKAASRRCS